MIKEVAKSQYEFNYVVKLKNYRAIKKEITLNCLPCSQGRHQSIEFPIFNCDYGDFVGTQILGVGHSLGYCVIQMSKADENGKPHALNHQTANSDYVKHCLVITTVDELSLLQIL